MSDPDGWMVIRADGPHMLMSREEAVKAAATATNRAALGGRTAVYVVAAVTIDKEAPIVHYTPEEHDLATCEVGEDGDTLRGTINLDKVTCPDCLKGEEDSDG